VTLRLPVQPLDSHDTTLESGTSRDMSGPDLRSKPRTSFRNASFSSSHRWARGPGGGRIELEEGQVVDDLEQISWPSRVQQLGADGDAPSLGLGQLMGRHERAGYGCVANLRRPPTVIKGATQTVGTGRGQRC
jgi:hypothetical protein